jgi:hypothetical protein
MVEIRSPFLSPKSRIRIRSTESTPPAAGQQHRRADFSFLGNGLISSEESL